MKTSVELTVIPIGAGTSISGYIAQCCRILEAAGLSPEVHAHGTSIEGEWDEVFSALRQCHEALHGQDVARVFTEVKVNTRTDREQTPQEKVDSVLEKMSG